VLTFETFAVFILDKFSKRHPSIRGAGVWLNNCFSNGMMIRLVRVGSHFGAASPLCLVALTILLSHLTTCAADYYVDFQGGLDSNSGLSRTNAWRTIPGTCDPANSGYLSTSWGSAFTSSSKVPPGTVFHLKSGTICGTNTGCGRINISSVFYSADATRANSILFQRDTSWGSGSVVFEGNGVIVGTTTGWGLIQISVGGVSFDGVSGVTDGYDGIVVQNSDRVGICYYADAMTEGGLVNFVKFFSCGKIYTASTAVASEGHLYVKFHTNGVVTNCEFDGNGNWHNGIELSSDNRVQNYFITNCVARNLQGSDSYQWVGIGFKAQNSVATWYGCTAYSNYKGWDPGQNDGDSSYPISYTLINCTSYSNQFGINLNGTDAGIPWPGGITFKLINCIVYGNQQFGSKIYAGPYQLYMVHNVYHDNVTQLKIGPDGLNDGNKVINAYLYNNVFYKPKWTSVNTCMTILGGAWGGQPVPVNFTLNSDYNCYVATTNEYFCRWSFWNAEPGGGTNVFDFGYGSNGPGYSSGNWFNFYGANATWQPTNGSTGHYHCDANSKGTRMLDPTLPAFVNVGQHDYHLTAPYIGVNLADISHFPWYRPEMGVDREGVQRTSWNIGAFENVVSSTTNKLSTIDSPRHLSVVTPH